MAHNSGNPTWLDYPAATTPISAARLEGLERGFDGMNPLTRAGFVTGKLYMASVEAQSVGVGAEFTLLNQAGPGSVQSVWMAVGNGAGPALDARLRVFYDGSATPAVDVDLGTLLATHFGASGASHTAGHVHAEMGPGFGLSFLLTFPMPFGTSIKVTYYNSSTVAALIYSMVTYRLSSADYANGLRMRSAGARYVSQAIARQSSTVTTLLDVTGAGWVAYHSQVGGVGAVNLSWMERNFQIQVDSEPSPQITATGTEDWFDSGWYFQGLKDFNAGSYSYVGTDQPAAPNQYVVGMATDLLAKWGGVPFTTAVKVSALSEAAVSTGDTFCYCILYYS